MLSSASPARAAGRVLAGAAAAGGALLAYGSLVERRAYTVREVTVPVLPAGAASLRVLHLSDLHLAPWQHDRVAWVRGLARLHPDLVIDTGDNFGHVDALPAILEALGPLLALPGGFVYGSNDYFTPLPKNPLAYLLHTSRVERERPDIDTAALTHRLVEAGWHRLDNRSAVVTVHGLRIGLVGTGDAHLREDAPRTLRRNLTSLPADVDLVLGVTHAPYRRVLDGFASMGADLVLAGHTHGGQVRVPGVGALTANCDLPPALARGLHVWRWRDRRMPLNVSAGVGTSIYAPIRFACRPEVTLLTLVPRQDAAR